MTPLPLPSPAVVFCEVEGGAVLLSTVDETYYGLNPVGARIWTLLPPAHGSLESLCEALAGEYPDVDPLLCRTMCLIWFWTCGRTAW